MGTIIVIGIVTGLATVLGAFITYLIPFYSRRAIAPVFGVAAGIMVGLSLFGLLPEGHAISGQKIVILGFFFGILLMRNLERFVGAREANREESVYTGMGYLIAVGIALHDFPEGLAMGAGFRGGDELGYLIAFSLALHNIPEGISIAAPLKKGGSPFLRVLALTTGVSLVTPLGAVAGWLLSDLSPALLGLFLGLAAGAMIFISFDALIPSAQRLDKAFGNGGIFCGILIAFLLSL